MDIPAPDAGTASEGKILKVTVAKASTNPSDGLSQSLRTTTGQMSSAGATDNPGAKIAELITSKKYHLAIKEKRVVRLVTLGFTVKKPKHQKKKLVKKTDSTDKVKSRANKYVQVGLLIILILGFIIAVDAGYVNVGITLPFDLIK